MATSDYEHIARELISGGESYYVEFKSAWDFGPDGKNPRDIKDVARDIGRTLVAFANADGGDLLVGVEDQGTITGVPWEGDRLRYLEQAARTQVMEAELGAEVHELLVDGQRVLLFRVAEYAGDPVVTADGRCLIRKQAQSVPISPREIDRRRRQVLGDLGYEAELVKQATVDDLDLELMVRRPGQDNPRFDRPETLLRYWNLAEGRNGHITLRRAALLLFAKEPLRWHPNNRVRIRRVHGESEGFGRNLRTRETEVAGPIASAIHQTLSRLNRTFEAESKIGSLFTTTQLLPTEAVEECVVNSLIHRNYAIEGQAIEILLFPDRVEFKSPGSLAEPITIRDLQKQGGVHRSRNPIIMRVMRDLGWSRDQGEGMRRIFGAMRQVELHEPELEVASDTFIVRLSTRSLYDEATQAWISSYAPFGLQPDERKFIVAIRRAGGALSIDRLARVLSVPFDQARGALVRLERRGIVWHGKRSRSYRIVEPLNVPHELAYRALTLSKPITSDAVITLDDLQAMTSLSDIRTLLALVDRWKESGILTPTGPKEWRFGESILEYARRRTG